MRVPNRIFGILNLVFLEPRIRDYKEIRKGFGIAFMDGTRESSVKAGFGKSSPEIPGFLTAKF